MIEKEYEPIATSSDPNFDLENVNLDGGDHLLVVQAVNEEGEVSEYSEEAVYTQEHSVYAIEKTTLTAIADSVRAKTGKTDPIPTEDLPSEIESIITGGGIIPSGSVNISENGVYDVTTYEKANVNVPIPDGYIRPSGERVITENGTVDVANFESAIVDVPIPEDHDGSMRVEETTATYEVSGVWTFYDKPNVNLTGGQNISFVSDSNNFDYIVLSDEGYMGYGYGSYNDGKDDYLVAYSSEADWTMGDDYKNVDFGDTPQSVSREFYKWLTSNAAPNTASDIQRTEYITLTFNGVTKEVEIGTTITIPCNGKVMTSDIVITRT